MSKKQLGFDAIENNGTLLYDLNKYLHANPELAFKETKAHDYLTNLLEKQGCKVERNFVHDTGFKAVFETAPKPHFGILVEYDALPNIGHGCGHNLIAEASISAALGLIAIMRDGAKCKLSIFGTPAEEGGGGKVKFVTDGKFADVDMCVMSHPFRQNLLFMIHLAVMGLTITFNGKASHASAAPWEGKNALDAAVLAYNGLSCLRQQIRPSVRIHGVITRGGDVPNVIPSMTEMKYYVRDLTSTGVRNLLPQVYSIFESAAQMSGCTVKIVENCPMYDDLKFVKTLTELFSKNALELGINFSPGNRDLAASSDVGNVSKVVPCIQPTFEIGTTAENHTPDFAACTKLEPAHKFALRQGKAMMGVLVDVLEDASGDLMNKIKADFARDDPFPVL